MFEEVTRENRERAKSQGLHVGPGGSTTFLVEEHKASRKQTKTLCKKERASTLKYYCGENPQNVER